MTSALCFFFHHILHVSLHFVLPFLHATLYSRFLSALSGYGSQTLLVPPALSDHISPTLLVSPGLSGHASPTLLVSPALSDHTSLTLGFSSSFRSRFCDSSSSNSSYSISSGSSSFNSSCSISPNSSFNSPDETAIILSSISSNFFKSVTLAASTENK